MSYEDKIAEYLLTEYNIVFTDNTTRINVRDVCSKYGICFNGLMARKKFRLYYETMSEIKNITMTELCTALRGGRGDDRGTWLMPYMVSQFVAFLDPKYVELIHANLTHQLQTRKV